VPVSSPALLVLAFASLFARPEVTVKQPGKWSLRLGPGTLTHTRTEQSNHPINLTLAVDQQEGNEQMQAKRRLEFHVQGPPSAPILGFEFASEDLFTEHAARIIAQGVHGLPPPGQGINAIDDLGSGPGSDLAAPLPRKGDKKRGSVHKSRLVVLSQLNARDVNGYLKNGSSSSPPPSSSFLLLSEKTCGACRDSPAGQLIGGLLSAVAGLKYRNGGTASDSTTN